MDSILTGWQRRSQFRKRALARVSVSVRLLVSLAILIGGGLARLRPLRILARPGRGSVALSLSVSVWRSISLPFALFSLLPQPISFPFAMIRLLPQPIAYSLPHFFGHTGPIEPFLHHLPDATLEIGTAIGSAEGEGVAAGRFSATPFVAIPIGPRRGVGPRRRIATTFPGRHVIRHFVAIPRPWSVDTAPSADARGSRTGRVGNPVQFVGFAQQLPQPPLHDLPLAFLAATVEFPQRFQPTLQFGNLLQLSRPSLVESACE